VSTTVEKRSPVLSVGLAANHEEMSSGTDAVLGRLGGLEEECPWKEGNPNEGQHPITPDTIHRIASASNEERARDGQSSQSERASGAARRIHLRPAAATA